MGIKGMYFNMQLVGQYYSRRRSGIITYLHLMQNQKMSQLPMWTETVT
jgi:hypothetical protein